MALSNNSKEYFHLKKVNKRAKGKPTVRCKQEMTLKMTVRMNNQTKVSKSAKTEEKVDQLKLN